MKCGFRSLKTASSLRRSMCEWARLVHGTADEASRMQKLLERVIKHYIISPRRTTLAVLMEKEGLFITCSFRDGLL